MIKLFIDKRNFPKFSASQMMKMLVNNNPLTSLNLLTGTPLVRLAFDTANALLSLSVK